ncbi:Disease resistance protein [Corchorus olitorius]|uniref:Disease resistance protein n=1 Tax=Corchorus olitorius TaxID=93759 RepID=A0A1R3H879_9ROSI|nr:Disease resistance protein [Corchorus olitorius]
MEDLISTVQNQLITIVIEEVNLLRGVDAELEKLTDNLQAIQAVLEDAEKRQVMEATVKLWVEKLKDVSYDIDDVLDEWNTSILKQQNSDEDARKVCSLPTLSCGGFSFCQVGLRHVIAVKIQELNARWEPLKNSLLNASPESRVLITTRKEKVAEVMGSRREDMVSIETLSKEWCWKLFSHLAFSGRSDEDCKKLRSVGEEILEKCKGLPLAVKTVGSLLRFKKTEQQWLGVRDSKTWEIEKVEEDVFSPLLLSYYDLPSVLKQCFLYCAIFPQDYVIKKDELIKLWMAQGFLNKITQQNKVEMVLGPREEKETEDMEKVGEEYFHELAIRSFFQDFERDENGEIVKCKMHDMMHSFARFLMEKEFLLVKVDGLEEPWKVNLPSKTIRHLTLVMGVNIAYPVPMYNWEKVRSLLILPSGWGSRRERNLLNNIDKLPCLRTLHVNLGVEKSQWADEILPKTIGKLIHLRYLNLSHNNYSRTLPEAICELYNLLILDISNCYKLCRLPEGIGKLKNLRHLENRKTESLTCMPKGMTRLTTLRTLREFTVGRDEKMSSSKLGDLGKLRHLQGSLRIRGMQNVEEASEAKEASLSTKAGLHELVLEFEEFEERSSGGENEAVVVEALQPPPCLQSFQIYYSNGPTTLFPSWMTSLAMLKTVRLICCFNWETLPPLGKLPSLESLSISWMRKVKKLGQEFLGIERQEGDDYGESSSATKGNIIAFPNLQKFEMWEMVELEDWEYGNLFSNSSTSSSSGGITIMPRLHSLRVENCYVLKALPRHLFSHLQQLRIRSCAILKQRFKQENGEDWQYISHIPNLDV